MISSGKTLSQKRIFATLLSECIYEIHNTFSDKINELYYDENKEAIYISYNVDIYARSCHVDTESHDYFIPIDVLFEGGVVLSNWKIKEDNKRTEAKRKQYIIEKAKNEKDIRNSKLAEYNRLQKELFGEENVR